MKKISVVIFMAMLFIVGSIGTSMAAGVKIGVVNFQKVLSTSSPGKMASAEMNKKGKEMEATVKQKEEELMALQKTLEREALVMGKDKSEQKQREFRIKANDYKTLKAGYLKEFKQIQARHFNKIKTEVLTLAAELGKKKGYDLILETNEGGVMYYNDAIDITDELIKAYNKKAASAK
ncbi:periplasmic chaperone for outer membrane proteins Skp [Desulfocicer vacuolatum DSM 3385]|uniref:Periplasmic chaperone for outer membrane proteins Skp n=1 Tax=Desulfocicer vacuolatum DSM 3385 TaxID=1121400 RepID=A0A1W1ZLP1_9BACT|nr:OmpH family outer membrane protein [Desulfocicer vacuolatum]SMC49304.1 periplasmic chaperone for outer membrane proteins Skp [Desulfocicer vacuolatum DSM 3385]